MENLCLHASLVAFVLRVSRTPGPTRRYDTIMKVKCTNPLKTPETNTSPTTSEQFPLSKTLFGPAF